VCKPYPIRPHVPVKVRWWSKPPPPLTAFTSCLSGLMEPAYSDGTFTWLFHSKLFHEIAVVLMKSFLFTSAKLFTLQLYEFASFWMQCNSMFVIVSYSGIFWLVTHSSPINHKGGHVFHQIRNTVCLLKTTVHSMYMYLPQNTITNNNFVPTEGSYILFLPLAHFMC